MKNINRIFGVGVFLSFMLLFSGCEDEFLETSPTTDISEQQVFQTVEGAQTVMDGLYRWLREFDSGGTGRHEDMGQKSVDITLDVLDGRDVMIYAPSWYYFDHNLEFDYTVGTYSKGRGIWEFYYKIINNVNGLLANIDEAEGSQSEIDRLKGESLALRAYAYFYLVNIYQHAYIQGEDQPGVPIYTEPTTSESKGNPRSSVGEVYDQIISDLEEAIGFLPSSGARGNKSHVNVNVAKAILARAYLFMDSYSSGGQSNWELAAQYAQEAREGYDLCTPDDYVSGFNNYNNPEWIWGLPFNQDQQHYYYSFYSMYDLERAAGYFQMRANNVFFDKFSANDIRAKESVGDEFPLIVYKEDPPIENDNYVTVADSLVIRKFRDTPNQTGHYVLIRSAEMFLIEAEAYAEEGQYADAQDALFEVQKRADENAVKSTATGQDLIDEILLERRKELYGEGLASTLDLKRRNLPLVREGNHYFGGELPAGSNKLVWQIPQDEIDANENIGEEDQNPL